MAPINWDECDLLPRFECSVCATTAVPWGRTPDDHYFCSSRCASATATATAATHDDTPSLPPVIPVARWTPRSDRRPRHRDRSARRCDTPPASLPARSFVDDDEIGTGPRDESERYSLLGGA